MTRKVFLKLLGLLILLLVINAVIMEVVLRRLAPAAASETLRALSRSPLWAALITLAIALPLAAWVAWRVTGRLQRVVERPPQSSGQRRLTGHGSGLEPDR